VAIVRATYRSLTNKLVQTGKSIADLTLYMPLWTMSDHARNEELRGSIKLEDSDKTQPTVVVNGAFPVVRFGETIVASTTSR